MKDADAVLGGKTARACDSCIQRRARWFCAADDAFLCHHCDNLVHSANPLATRHDRIRLQASSSKPISSSWFAGFTRKPRTPRHHGTKNVSVFLNTLPLVPDLGYEEHPPLLDHTTEDHQLFGRVPVFHPFDYIVLDTTVSKDEEVAGSVDLDDFSEFLPSDMDLAEFAADVESLLGNGSDEESPEMKGSELFDCQQKQEEEEEGRSGMVVKVKDETVDTAVDISAGDVLINWKGESYEDEKLVVPKNAVANDMDSVGSESKIFLRLNYEDIISAWDNQGCPWSTGHTPHFSSPHQYHCLGWSGGSKGEAGSLRGHVVDGEREARVSRYREKRRTRLFAKKIRYQVRKLNAEKRPRMKGRFVKRT